jgi:immunoglobulin-like protein involved in spore germination
VTAGRTRLLVSIAAASGRFKYAGYRVLHSPERLVVDLYKAAPPRAGATARYGPPGCLAFTSVATPPRRVAATGSERDVFEHSFPVRVRSAGGRVLGQRPVAAAAGRWSTSVRYRVARPQTGTLEAVELSAKDGALRCLAQVPARLRP